MKKSNIDRILTYVISITFILTAFLGTVHFCCFDEDFYARQHNKIMLYGKHINEHIGISNDELSDLTHFTLSYLNNPNASLDLVMNVNGVDREVFTNDEKAHMVDVRNLNLASVYICIAAFMVFSVCMIYYLIKKKSIYYLFSNYKKTLLYSLLFFGILGLWIMIDFDSFWTLFHKIFFTGNDLWILNLRKDILIMIVPPEFFNNLVIRILILFILSIVLFGLVLFLANRKKKIYD